MYAEIMIHQPVFHGNGVRGQATDVLNVSEQLQKTKKRLNTILAENTGKSIEEIVDATERDNYMSSEEALEFGLIDKIIEYRI